MLATWSNTITGFFLIEWYRPPQSLGWMASLINSSASCVQITLLNDSFVPKQPTDYTDRLSKVSQVCCLKPFVFSIRLRLSNNTQLLGSLDTDHHFMNPSCADHEAFFSPQASFATLQIVLDPLLLFVTASWQYYLLDFMLVVLTKSISFDCSLSIDPSRLPREMHLSTDRSKL